MRAAIQDWVDGEGSPRALEVLMREALSTSMGS